MIRLLAEGVKPECRDVKSQSFDAIVQSRRTPVQVTRLEQEGHSISRPSPTAASEVTRGLSMPRTRLTNVSSIRPSGACCSAV